MSSFTPTERDNDTVIADALPGLIGAVAVPMPSGNPDESRASMLMAIVEPKSADTSIPKDAAPVSSIAEMPSTEC